MREKFKTTTLESDTEFRTVFQTVTTGDGRSLAKWDSAVCTECDRGDEVRTEKRTKGLVTVKRHACKRCQSYGATVIEGGVTPSDTSLWTKGDVITVDLGKSENEEYRHTF